MKKKILKIQKEDYERIVLTEVLPYEVPILFSNEKFYEIIKSGLFKKIHSSLSSAKNNWTIPFDYKIKDSNLKERTLSVMHPIKQIDFIDFYKNYTDLILYHTSKSEISLRKSTRVARLEFQKKTNTSELPIKTNSSQTTDEDETTRVYKSYFVYEPLDLVYKFYEKHSFRRFEQKFSIFMTFDISKCFYNIYTHSISWAVRGKILAKNNIGQKSFDNDFDSLMQKSNYNETHGIIVGPEISRIFAEVILQAVDLRVLKRLESGIHQKGKDFEIRRYVDDYFVFSNDLRVAELIYSIFIEELSKFKLHINPIKKNVLYSPFVTKETIGKRLLGDEIESLFNQVITKSPGQNNSDNDRIVINLKNGLQIANKFISRFQVIVFQNQLKYENLSKEIIRKFLYYLNLVRSKLDIKNEESYKEFILMILDVVFYAYSFCINSSSTFKVSQVIIVVLKESDNFDKNYKNIFINKIINEVDLMINILRNKINGSQGNFNMDLLNLLIALTKLQPQYFISEEKLIQLFNLENEDERSKLNYFELVSILYYIKNHSQFEKLKNLLVEAIFFRYSQMKNNGISLKNDSELFMLFFDIIVCPYLDTKIKNKVFVEQGNCFTKDKKEIIGRQNWFFNWDADIDIEPLLIKKEWSSVY